MIQVEGEIIIRRPPEEVFDFVADERNDLASTRRCIEPRSRTDP